MVVRNNTRDESHKRSSNRSKKIMAVPHPNKNWRHKGGVWYFVKENEKTHKGDYHRKFLLPALRKWRQSRKKTVKKTMKKKVKTTGIVQVHNV